VPQGADGVSVTNITSTNNTGSGATNTITVTLSDNTTKTFNVKNGTNGTTPNITTQQITNGYQILVDNTVVATVNNGTNGQDGHSPSVTTRSTSGGYEILVDGSIVATVTNGANGLNSATVFLYKRAASASKPSSGSSTYTFSTGQLANVPSG
jgi:TfoX/Sxy family transcriptional regulator of competence genes